MHSRMDTRAGAISGAVRRQVYLSDLSGLFDDIARWRAMVTEHDVLIYEVYFKEPEQPECAQLAYGTTILYPIKVGSEYAFTRGHRHARLDRTEVYQVLQGTGCLLLRDAGGKIDTVALEPGVVAYIFGGLAHRVINSGPDPLVWFAVYPADAGHDYDWVAQHGFGQRLVEINGRPEWVEYDGSHYARG